MEHSEQRRFPPQNAPADNETTATNDDPTNNHLQQQLQQQPRVTDERANEEANVTSNDDNAMTRMMTMKEGHGDEDADARWEEYKSHYFKSKVTKKKRWEEKWPILERRCSDERGQGKAPNEPDAAYRSA